MIIFEELSLSNKSRRLTLNFICSNEVNECSFTSSFVVNKMDKNDLDPSHPFCMLCKNCLFCGSSNGLSGSSLIVNPVFHNLKTTGIWNRYEISINLSELKQHNNHCDDENKYTCSQEWSNSFDTIKSVIERCGFYSQKWRPRLSWLRCAIYPSHKEGD